MGSLTSTLNKLDVDITSLQNQLKDFWKNRSNSGWQAREMEQQLQQLLQSKIHERLSVRPRDAHARQHGMRVERASADSSFFSPFSSFPR